LDQKVVLVEEEEEDGEGGDGDAAAEDWQSTHEYLLA
jgi:hypothetical protein